MRIDEHYKESIGGSREAFIDFVKINTEDMVLDVNDIDFLLQRIAQNLFYFEDNFATAKSDYITLIAMLMKKGVVFENRKQ